jgi:catechol 2,3-dioxygenase-like lactoylglutathione lyase family enzyme
MAHEVAPAAGIDFYHAMVYVSDVGRSVRFYQQLGLEVVEERPGYARMRCPSGVGTLALHEPDAGSNRSVSAPGIRLYFEVRDLVAFCETLVARGIVLDEAPRLREWGWTHAYLKDPDQHELSLFWAGQARLQPD